MAGVQVLSLVDEQMINRIGGAAFCLGRRWQIDQLSHGLR
jgi:hypothetical protein